MYTCRRQPECLRILKETTTHAANDSAHAHFIMQVPCLSVCESSKNATRPCHEPSIKSRMYGVKHAASAWCVLRMPGRVKMTYVQLKVLPLWRVRTKSAAFLAANDPPVCPQHYDARTLAPPAVVDHAVPLAPAVGPVPSLLVDGLFDASVLMAVPAVSADSCCACGGTSFELSDGLIASSANGKV